MRWLSARWADLKAEKLGRPGSRQSDAVKSLRTRFVLVGQSSRNHLKCEIKTLDYSWELRVVEQYRRQEAVIAKWPQVTVNCARSIAAARALPRCADGRWRWRARRRRPPVQDAPPTSAGA